MRGAVVFVWPVLAIACLGQDQAAEQALVAFARDGNVHVMDLVTRTEVASTTDGGTAGVSCFCPVLAGPDRLLYIRWVGDDYDPNTDRQAYELSPLDAEPAPLEGCGECIGLGWSAPDESTLCLTWAGPRPTWEEIEFAELAVVRLTADGATSPTPLRSYYGGIDFAHTRIRVSRDGLYAAVPNFPTDVSARYAIYETRTGATPAWIERDFLYWAACTGVDFGRRNSYATYDVPDAPGTRYSGVYRFSPARGIPQKVLGLSGARGIAVSETLGIAVVGTSDVTGRRQALHLVNLRTWEREYLCEGSDPDIWPR